MQGWETRNVCKAGASKKKEWHDYSYFEKKVINININLTDIIKAILLLKLNYYCLYFQVVQLSFLIKDIVTRSMLAQTMGMELKIWC